MTLNFLSGEKICLNSSLFETVFESWDVQVVDDKSVGFASNVP